SFCWQFAKGRIRRGGRGDPHPSPPLTNHGKFFSTLDELAAAQAPGLRHCGRLRIDRSDVVLRDAKIHEGRLHTDPASAVSARYSRHAARNGLPVLSQLRGDGSAVECAKHANVHELPHSGAKRPSKA